MRQEITAGENDAGLRADLFLVEKTGLSRSRLVKAIEAGQVTINGRKLIKHREIKAGQVFCLDIIAPEPLKATAENIPLKIIYEDKDIIVIDKPAGLVTHPAPGHPGGTLVNALLGRWPEIKSSPEDLRPGLVHRLDKDTSGVMVVAKNQKAEDFLSREIKERKIKKKYRAVVYGIPKKTEGEIDLPMGRNPRDRKKMSVIRDARLKRRSALTLYKVLEKFNGASLLELEIITGRTHQIRVHLLALGHPVIGDTVYGRKDTSLIDRQALHARTLGFTHPTSGKKVEFVAELPPDIEDLLTRLRGGIKVE